MTIKPKAMLLSIRDLAEAFSCTECNIRNMVKVGRLPGPTIRGIRMVRWDADDIRQWIKDQKKKGE